MTRFNVEYYQRPDGKWVNVLTGNDDQYFVSNEDPTTYRVVWISAKPRFFLKKENGERVMYEISLFAESDNARFCMMDEQYKEVRRPDGVLTLAKEASNKRIKNLDKYLVQTIYSQFETGEYD